MSDTSRRTVLYQAAAAAVLLSSEGALGQQIGNPQGGQPAPNGSPQPTVDDRITKLVGEFSKLINAPSVSPASTGSSPTADRFTKLSDALTQLTNKINSIKAAPGGEGSSEQKQLYKRDLASWHGVEFDAKRLYGVSSDLASASTLQIGNISESFSYTAHANDSAFRYQFVELLLDQAADLLERALANRREWNLLAARSFEVAADIQQYFELDKIHQEETAAGFYTNDSAEALNDSANQKIALESAMELASFILFILNTHFNIGTINDTLDAAKLQSWLAHLATYDTEAKGNIMSYSWGVIPPTQAQNLAINAAERLSTHSLFVDAGSWQAQWRAAQINITKAGNQSAIA